MQCLYYEAKKGIFCGPGEIAELGTSSYGEYQEFKEDHSFDFEEINDDESICEGVVNDATVDEETNNDEINDEEAIVENQLMMKLMVKN